MLQLRVKPKNNLGASAENFAADLLKSKGYKIICRNFRSRFGEIDIIAEFDSTLIFIEVKARQSLKFGYPEEAVTGQKLIKIVKTAEYFCLTNPGLPKKLRIEVVSLLYKKDKIYSSKIIPID